MQACDSLVELVERLLIKRTLGALGLANKAGLAVAGTAKVEGAIAGGGVAALVHGAEASDDGVNKLDRRYLAMCRDANRRPMIVRDLTIEQLSLALGRSNVVHAALTTGGATDLFMSEARRLHQYKAERLDRPDGKQAASRLPERRV